MQKKIEKEIKLILPIPCSVNIAYVNIWKKRIKSEAYNSFSEQVFNYFLLNDLEYTISWDKWLEVNYIYYFSLYTKEWKKRIKDVFNYEKVLSDVLWHYIKWFKDHKIKKWIVEKIDSEKEYVEVVIKEII